jgi:hypothetical protein
MASKKNASTIVAICTLRIKALPVYASSGPITVHGTSTPEAAAVAVYQASIDTRTKVTSLRGQLTAALAARRAADVAMTAMDAGVRDWVLSTFGPSSQAAVDFGYAKKAPVKPSVEVKAAAAKKAVATRDARGVVGSKKRKAVQAPTPPATTATPAATTAPPTTTTVAGK